MESKLVFKNRICNLDQIFCRFQMQAHVDSLYHDIDTLPQGVASLLVGDIVAGSGALAQL